MGLPLRLKTDAPTEGVDETGAWRDLGQFGPATAVVTIDADAASAGIGAGATVGIDTSDDGVTAAAPDAGFPVSVGAAPVHFRHRIVLQRYVRYNTGSTTPAGAKATLTTALTGANNDLTFTAKRKGVAGNSITVHYVDPGGVTATLAVPPVVGTDIVVNLGRAASAINSTAAQVMAAILAEPTAAALVDVANAGGNDGTGIVTALAQTPLANGVDPARIAIGVSLDLPLTD